MMFGTHYIHKNVRYVQDPYSGHRSRKSFAKEHGKHGSLFIKAVSTNNVSSNCYRNNNEIISNVSNETNNLLCVFQLSGPTPLSSIDHTSHHHAQHQIQSSSGSTLQNIRPFDDLIGILTP